MSEPEEGLQFFKVRHDDHWRRAEVEAEDVAELVHGGAHPAKQAELRPVAAEEGQAADDGKAGWAGREVPRF